MTELTLSEESQVLLARLRAIKARAAEHGIKLARGNWVRRRPHSEEIERACPVSQVIWNYQPELLARSHALRTRQMFHLAASLLEVEEEFVWGLMKGNDKGNAAWREYRTIGKPSLYWQGVEVGIRLNQES